MIRLRRAFTVAAAAAALVLAASATADQAGASVQAAGRTLTVSQHGTGDYRSIQAAADAARPGDTVLIDGGIYRETVTVPAMDTTAGEPVRFVAAPGQHPVLTGADRQTGWVQIVGGMWQLTRGASYFGSFNPFAARWASGTLPGSSRARSSGGVYLDATVLAEQPSIAATQSTPYSWTASVDASGTTVITANFAGADPNTHDTEINRREQVFTAAWNQAYVDVEGLTIMRGAGTKDINYWRSAAKPTDGALSVNGGYKWTIRGNTFIQNSGVALDFGMGSQGVVDAHGGFPAHYGSHLIDGNLFQDNATNGAFAWRSPFTVAENNRFVNNDTDNTGLVSEAAFKIVDEGPGVRVTHNYFYSNQDWSQLAIWMDSEIQDSVVAGNVMVNTGGVSYEANLANNLFANNVMLNQPMPDINAGPADVLHPRGALTIYESSGTKVVNNLFDNVATVTISTGSAGASGGGLERPDGVARRMRLFAPGTNTPTGLLRVRVHENLFADNLFYGQGLQHEGFSQPQTVDENALNTGDATVYAANRFWDNAVDYNVYYGGAQPVNDFNSYPVVPDSHSAAIAGNFSAPYACGPSRCSVNLQVDGANTPESLGAPAITSDYLGTSDLLPGDRMPGVGTDIFGAPRTGPTATAGPFASTHTGTRRLTLWSGPAEVLPVTDFSVNLTDPPSHPGIVQPGQPAVLSATFANEGSATLTGASLRMLAPEGWTVAGGATLPQALPPGSRVTGTWRVSVPTGVAPGTYQLSGTATFRYGGSAIQDSSTAAATVSVPYRSLADAFNNVGISDDSDPAAGSFGAAGSGRSYSAEALAAATPSITPGAVFSHDGLSFTWPSAAPGTPDNIDCAGQTIPLSGSGTTLGLIGAANNGTVTGTAFITYTDGTTQPFPLAFADWWANSPAPGGDIVTSMPYINTANGRANQEVSLYYASAPLAAGKTPAWLTLPNVRSGSQKLHVFTVAIG